MPLTKRSTKRSSSSSYASTVTTIVFVALCILGVWMLSSTSISPPQTTTNVSSKTSDVFSSNDLVVDQTGAKSNDKTVFEDNPGHLPDDAIKSDDTKQTTNNNNNNQVSEESTFTQNQQTDQSQQHDQVQINPVTKTVESVDAWDQKSKTELQQPQQPTEHGTGSNENEQQPKQETAGSNESNNTESTQNNQKSNSEEMIKQEDSTNLTHLVTNEDNEKRIQQHQQQKEEQKVAIDQTPNTSTAHESINTSSHKHRKKRAKEHKPGKTNTGENFLGGTNPGIPKESIESKKSWSTQKAQSENEKERRKEERTGEDSIFGYTWELCNTSAGFDYIPCLDNEKALKKLTSTRHYEHRERHCPEEGPTCLVPLPQGYKRSIGWPKSRDKIWYHNVPHTSLAEIKGHQNWVKVTGEFLTFPGGGTQFIHGALHYIDLIQQSIPEISWGKHTRVVLDVGCGVASFGGYLFERDVLTMSFAPKDEHEAQVQFALERGIPAISAVMGTQRLQFPSRVFDVVHCARCRVPWHVEGGKLLLELNRVLRPGGYFIWSATPVYQKLPEDVQIWEAMTALTISMCWDLVTIKKDKLNNIGIAFYRKPTTNECYEQRKNNTPPMCKNDDDANAAWYVPLQACMHPAPVETSERGNQWPEEWPHRMQAPPYWLNSSQMGIYGKPAPLDFEKDYEHWKQVVGTLYMSGLGISWSNVRNVMDMRAVYGGFAAALKDLQVWVMNVVNVDCPDTLPIIYERGLFGIYHDWCESFSTYPRTYDLLHADHLFSKLKMRCKLAPVMAEVDRITRPGGKLIVRDESSAVNEVENLLKSLHWEVHLTFSKDQEGILSAQKGNWRPDMSQPSS